jgi:glycine oxidase
VGTADIIVAGAGVIGLACALELRRRGANVIVLERGQPMREASWAAAGMLAACDPENPSALLELAVHSQELYDGFLRHIETLSGIAVPYRSQETLQQLVRDHSLPPNRPPPLPHHRELSPAEAERHLPGLSSGGHRFLLLPERSLDPRDLCLAMPLAARAAGIEIRSGVAVRSVSLISNGVRVETDDGGVEAGSYLNCMGAWAGAREYGFCQGTPDAGTTIVPRKGQMAMVRMPKPRDLTSVIRSKAAYLVPRGDGCVVVGATVEDAGFDKQVSPQALQALLGRAAALWPALREAPIVDRWAGLRPGTTDDLPLIGRAESGPAGRTGGATARCFIAAGHFRNGILLAPATADVVASLMAGEPPRVALEAFAPDRAGKPELCDKLFTAAL